MKTVIRLLAIFLVVGAISMALCIGVFAGDSQATALDMMISSGTAVLANQQSAVSSALEVIAYQNQMAIAGISGNSLSFSSDRFMCAMNLSDIESITITSLPDMSCGALYIGSDAVSVGQKINASDISLMTYEEANRGEGKKATFEFRVGDNTYDIICNIYMIDSVNYSPTVKMASYVSLNN